MLNYGILIYGVETRCIDGFKKYKRVYKRYN